MSAETYTTRELLKRSNVEKAVGAMLTLSEMKAEHSSDLLSSCGDPNAFVSLNVQLDREIAVTKIHPMRINGIKHSLHRGGDMFSGKGFCVVVADKVYDLAKSALEEDPEPLVKKLEKFSVFSKEYQQFKDRREVCKQFDAFIIGFELRNCSSIVFGRAFFKCGKQPIAVSTHSKKSFVNDIRKVANSTYIALVGDRISVRIARLGMSAEQIVENIMSCQEAILKHIPSEYQVRAMDIGAGDMPKFPVYHDKSTSKVVQDEKMTVPDDIAPDYIFLGAQA
eukprot:TRINITY_DN78435_c0_g1_i1.p1 TRINITY_DN78435_c0_g1~~TRINITY_DN78435_c0_g1_i1.p1  ORF type:complete len:297 (-),score=92.30 TRINITY_DN78435_c0_g1_i1:42-881(-)